MTLVVAKKFDDGVRLLADWRITAANATRQPNYLSGTLKAWILRQDLCIAYAGDDVEAAERGIRQLRIGQDTRPDLAELLTTLEKEHRAHAEPLEFIVASRIEGHNLWVIKEGKVSERHTTPAWIGDHEAFEKYQELRLSSPHSAGSTNDVSPSNQQFGSMLRAFSDLVRNGDVASVGEVAIAVIHDETGFRYSGAAVMMPSPQDIPSGEWTKVHFGTARTGGFGYVVIGAEPGVPAVGLYFPQGRIGVLFYPAQLGRDCPVFRNASQNEFCVRVQQEFSFQLLPDVSVS